MVQYFNPILQFMAQGIDRVSHLFFPKLCLHCKALLKNKKLFCDSCSHFFELSSPADYCRYCAQESEGKRVCKRCVRHRRFGIEVAAVMERSEVTFKFGRYLEERKMAELAKTAACFFALQLEVLGWQPECIVACPGSLIKRILRGGDIRIDIARHLSKLLGIRRLNVFDLLKKPDFSSKRVLFLTLYGSEYDAYFGAVQACSQRALGAFVLFWVQTLGEEG